MLVTALETAAAIRLYPVPNTKSVIAANGKSNGMPNAPDKFPILAVVAIPVTVSARIAPPLW